jgi:hypothetical protein
VDLAFLTDFSDKLNSVSLELQGKDKHMASMIGSVKPFRAKLVLWIPRIKTESLAHFQNVKNIVGDSDFNPSPLLGHVKALLDQLEHDHVLTVYV